MFTNATVNISQEEQNLTLAEKSLLALRDGDGSSYAALKLSVPSIWDGEVTKNFGIDTLYKILKFDADDFERIAKEKNVYVNAKNNEGETLLSLLLNQISLLKIQMQTNYAEQDVKAYKENELRYADHLTLLHILLKYVNVNELAHGLTPLQKAIMLGLSETQRILVEQNELNADIKSTAVLEISGITGKQTITDNNALQFALLFKQDLILDLLISHTKNINAQNTLLIAKINLVHINQLYTLLLLHEKKILSKNFSAKVQTLIVKMVIITRLFG